MEKVRCVVTCDPNKYGSVFFTKEVDFFRVPAAGEFIEMAVPKLGISTVKVLHVIHSENGVPVVFTEFA